MTQPAKPRPRRWLLNLAFAAAVLLAAGGLWLALGRRDGPAVCASADFGMGVIEQIPLDADYDYFYEVGGYVVHLQVRDGAIAFLASQCPDHVAAAGTTYDARSAALARISPTSPGRIVL